MQEYDFRCTSCDHEFTHKGDKFSSMDVYDEPCPHCGETGCIERGYVKKDLDMANWNGEAPGIIDGNRLAFKGHSTQHKEMLSRIHENTPGSQLDKKM